MTFVIAFGMIAYGIAQRTILAEPDSITASTVVSDDATVSVISSKTLKALDGRQSVTIGGPGRVFAAYGRTEDVLAWVGDASYNRIGINSAKTALTSKLVSGSETKVPDPRGSDLWLDEYSRSNSLNFFVNVPDDISIVVVSDGTKPAPNRFSISWPLDNRTPWSGPLIVGGGILLLIGLGIYLWAFTHLRRSRGPRRKTPKMPKVPKQRGYKPRKTGTVAAKGGRRSNARRMVAIVPILLVGTVALSGCSPELWPEFMTGGSSASATPTPTPTLPAGEKLQAPAVTLPQLKKIVAKVSVAAAKADAAIDPGMLKSRFEGPALELRTANYAIRKVDSTAQPAAVIPAGEVNVTLPQQSNTWPRTVFTVVIPSDKTVAPVALVLVQATPRANFKVDYATALEAGAKLPDVAPANVGAPRLKPGTKLLAMAPSDVALAYGDILEKGTESKFSKDFDLKNDALIGLIGFEARKALQAKVPATAAMTFANSDGPGDSIALGSNNAGAIVAVYLNETVTVKPVEAGASVNPEGAVKSLSGITGTTKGTVAVYGDQLLFYVPPASSKNKIVLLGFATGLVSAKELP
ncbi:MAG TPA: hypothetical protein DCP11_11765 [Microbacteriaceae bacterium]|nr:hypothetical protein [Microbacteriaceae bacterium]